MDGSINLLIVADSYLWTCEAYILCLQISWDTSRRIQVYCLVLPSSLFRDLVELSQDIEVSCRNELLSEVNNKFHLLIWHCSLGGWCM